MRGSRGLSLIELMVALAIFGILLMLAGPMYGQFMANHQIRNAADAMLNGVQQAQATAVQRNGHVCLIVTPRADADPPTKGGWQIVQDSPVDNCPEVPAPDPAPTNPIQVYKTQDGAPRAIVAPAPNGATMLVFDGFGRINDKLADDTAYTPITCIKVTHSLAGTRPLNVAISSTGTGVGTKLCDPSVVSTDPLGCPGGCS
jgi:type IV fimbrial biogenesis protein FimT